jgi:hypothetical protein
MLTRAHFPRAAFAPALAVALILTGAGAPGAARADDKDNAVSVHYLFSGGIGDSWSGNKVALDYGYRLDGPAWLDLQFNLQLGNCLATSCGRTGSVFELMAGGKWRFVMPTPFVPYVKAGAGPVFLFPDQARSAFGLAIRGGGGVNYFFFDWFGVGIEGDLSLGHAFFDSTFTGSHTYAVFDIGAVRPRP